jgi:hypothetical protein
MESRSELSRDYDELNYPDEGFLFLFRRHRGWNVQCASLRARKECNLAVNALLPWRNPKNRAKLVRRTHIPKGDGRQRPIGATVMEDKIVQRAVVEVRRCGRNA